MSRQIEFNNLEECNVQVAIPAEWLDPLAAAVDLVYRSFRENVEDPDESFTDEQIKDMEIMRGYYFNLWTRIDTLAMEFKKWQKRREK